MKVKKAEKGTKVDRVNNELNVQKAKKVKKLKKGNKVIRAQNGVKAKRLRTITSKWVKTKVLLRHPRISCYIPETVKLTNISLRQMLNKYNMVYIKPERGTYGNGVIRAEWVKDGNKGSYYKYQVGTVVRKFNTYEAFYAALCQYKKGRSYLVQMGIYLLKYQKRRFDIRVMVQRSPVRKWEATGIIGRVAHPGKIVTNYHSGGTPMAMEKLLAPHLSVIEQRKVLNQMSQLGVTIGEALQQKYPNFRQIGVDIGLDLNMKPWIIEVNTNPDPYIFNKLANKTMYRKVMKYRKFNG
ncbi:glutathione synthase/RimK-type ligase-like ATP-grasp enzyme [Paenibacillus sp. DS2015]|uniref:YheC/YheD family protein n=1 Tax=Paenibacillus sp. DS2015 TaxID=3373917 RepID=UPI003D22DA83